MIQFKNFASFIIIITTIIGVCNGLKITNLNVPSVYVLEKNPEPLMLDCEYEFDSTDLSGFILKWYMNNQNVYQWILGFPRPSAHGIMKNHININHPPSTNDDKFNHHTLEINKPTINMAGNYTCVISTFTGEEARTSNLKIIVPESLFQIKLTEETDQFNVECIVNDIFPEPKLTIFIGDDARKKKIDITTQSEHDDNDGLFDIHVIGTIKMTDIDGYNKNENGQPLVKCYLDVPDTNYTKLVEY